MGYRASFVKLSYESAKILPLTDSSYSEYLEFKKKFGEDGSVMVIGFQSPATFQLNVFRDWYALTNDIKNIEGIQEVVSTARCYHLVKNDSLMRLELKPLSDRAPSTQEEVDSVKQEILALPFYHGLLLNRQADVTLMAITLDQNKLNTKSRIETVHQVK